MMFFQLLFHILNQFVPDGPTNNTLKIVGSPFWVELIVEKLFLMYIISISGVYNLI